MTKLYLVRHGESEAQANGVLGGNKPTPLTPNGIKQSMNVGNQLAKADIRCFVSSRYKRAVDSMHYIGQQINTVNNDLTYGSFDFNNIVTYEQLNERHHGIFTNWYVDDVKKAFGEEVFESWFKDIYSKCPSGESLFDVYDRVIPIFVSEVYPKLKSQNVLLVAHNRVIQALMCFLDQKKPIMMLTYKVPNGAIFTYEF